MRTKKQSKSMYMKEQAPPEFLSSQHPHQPLHFCRTTVLQCYHLLKKKCYHLFFLFYLFIQSKQSSGLAPSKKYDYNKLLNACWELMIRVYQMILNKEIKLQLFSFLNFVIIVYGGNVYKKKKVKK